MIILTVVLLAIVIVCLSITWYQTKSRTAKLLNQFIPYDTYYPVIGNVLGISTKPDVLFHQIRTALKRLNPVIPIMAWVGPVPTLHIGTADYAEVILSSTKHIEKGWMYGLFNKWLAQGLGTSKGAKWHQRKKMLTSSFHYNILQMFVEIFGDKCDKVKEVLQQECLKPKTDIKPIIREFTLSTICETSMGTKLNESENTYRSYYEAITELTEIIVKRFLSPWFHPDILYYLSPLYWKEKSLLKILHGVTRNIIKERSKTFTDSDVTDLDSTDAKPKKRLAMLDLLLYNKRQFGTIDDDGIAEEVDTFVFAGHDTVGVGIEYTLLLLANHPEYQKKIIEELDQIFGDSDRHATYEDLQNMRYLELCIKESQRIYPSAPMIVRKVHEDVPLREGELTIPAGTDVFIHIYDIHRDPKYFPDPEKFDPNRFLPENSVGRHPFAYIPFSAGPRNCIGQKFAMLELKSVVSTVLRNFTMEAIDSPQDLDWITDVVLMVRGPINIKFIPRYETNRNVM